MTSKHQLRCTECPRDRVHRQNKLQSQGLAVQRYLLQTWARLLGSTESRQGNYSSLSGNLFPKASLVGSGLMLRGGGQPFQFHFKLAELLPGQKYPDMTTFCVSNQGLSYSI